MIATEEDCCKQNILIIFSVNYIKNESVVRSSVHAEVKKIEGSSHLVECNSDNSDLPRHQSLSDILGHHCSQTHVRDLCHPT